MTNEKIYNEKAPALPIMNLQNYFSGLQFPLNKIKYRTPEHGVSFKFLNTLIIMRVYISVGKTENHGRKNNMCK